MLLFWLSLVEVAGAPRMVVERVRRVVRRMVWEGLVGDWEGRRGVERVDRETSPETSSWRLTEISICVVLEDFRKKRLVGLLFASRLGGQGWMRGSSPERLELLFVIQVEERVERVEETLLI
jgi:hypothetical protein